MEEDYLIVQADDLSIIKWFSNASFVVHKDMKSHTGHDVTMGKEL